jgi:alpha-mannosidase
LYIDWRKRVVFYAELEPGQMNRFDCTVEFLPEKPKPALTEEEGKFIFQTDRLVVEVNTATGLIDELQVDGVPFLLPNAVQPIVIEDNDDAWGSQVNSFTKQIGAFKLMSKTKGSRVSGIRGKAIPSVRVIEDGAVRTVIEAVMEYGASSIVQRYSLPKHGVEIQVDVHVQWNETRKMLKLAIPTVWKEGSYLGQVAFGLERFPNDRRELVAQKWTAAASVSREDASRVGAMSDEGYVLTCVNDGTYGSDMSDGVVRLTLLRSPGYSALPGGKMKYTMPNDRYSNRIDQGERKFTFWLNGGPAAERLEAIDREALAHNEKPYTLSYFPSGAGTRVQPLMSLSDDVIQASAFKQADNLVGTAGAGGQYIVRLFEPTGIAREAVLSIPVLGIDAKVSLGAFEIKTYRVNAASRTIEEETLMESL